MSDELASWWLARTCRDGGAEAAHAIGVADVAVGTQDEAAASAGARRVGVVSVDSRWEGKSAR